MQSIIHEYDNPSTLFHQIESIYTMVSDEGTEVMGLIKPTFSDIFNPLFDVLEENVYYFNRPKTVPMNLPKTETPKEESIMVVCCSGGKDSVATAKHYIDAGYNVFLYHMHGINKVYYDEYTVIPEIAEHLNCRYYIDHVALCGTQAFTEHPMKNYIIANGAIAFCLEHNLPLNIAFGNFTDAHLQDVDFDVCAGDTVEMWDIYQEIVRSVFPNFRLCICLKNNSNTFQTLNQDVGLYPMSISCISPYRFREHWKNRTEKKYGVTLLPHRCGCCWKDAMEYIYMCDHNLIAFNKDYYIHCFDILISTVMKESGERDLTILDVWNYYLFYPIEESTVKELKYAVIRAGKTVITQ